MFVFVFVWLVLIRPPHLHFYKQIFDERLINKQIVHEPEYYFMNKLFDYKSLRIAMNNCFNHADIVLDFIPTV